MTPIPDESTLEEHQQQLSCSPVINQLPLIEALQMYREIRNMTWNLDIQEKLFNRHHRIVWFLPYWVEGFTRQLYILCFIVTFELRFSEISIQIKIEVKIIELIMHKASQDTNSAKPLTLQMKELQTKSNNI